MNRELRLVAERITRSVEAWDGSGDLLDTMWGSTELDTVRRQYGADLVMAVTDVIADCNCFSGVAYLPNTGLHRGSGFSVVSNTERGFIPGWLVAHEIGHNLGLAHQRGAEGTYPLRSHGRGHVGFDASLDSHVATIMATHAGDSRLKGTYFRSDRFSFDGFGPPHPAWTHYSVRLGDRHTRAADAARSAAPTVAAYEAKDPPDNDPPPEPEPEPSGVLHCSAGTCLLEDKRFRIRVRYSRGGMTGTATGLMGGELSDSVAVFSFGGDSPELMIRMVNHCAENGYWALHSGGVTDASYSIAVRDTTTNDLKWFRAEPESTYREDFAFPCN